MSDLIFVGIVAAFFALSGLYVRFCVQLDAGPRHAHWPLPDDCSHYGTGRFARAEEDFSAKRRDFSGFGRNVRGAPAWHGAADRRAEFSPGADPRPNCRALPDL